MLTRGRQVVSAVALLIPLVLSSRVVRADAAPARTPGYQRLVLSFEGLALLSDRYGINVEIVPAARDSVALNPWYITGHSRGVTSLGFPDGGPSTIADVQTRALGLDLQYRHYFGAFEGGGARGVFIAPGLEVAHFTTRGVNCSSPGDQPSTGSTGCLPRRQAWTYVGLSVDLGAQAILRPGFTIGGSIGLHYRQVGDGALDDDAMPASWDISHGSGVRPRLRFWLGWSFL